MFECNHPKLHLTERVSGAERKKIGESILINGIEESIEQNEIENFIHSSDTTYEPPVKSLKRGVLKTIKSELVHQNRLSNELISDIKAAKTLCDSFCLNSQTTDLFGFIQKISLDPFGFLLLSHIQVFFINANQSQLIK